MERDVDHCPQHEPYDVDPVDPQNGFRLLIKEAIICFLKGDLIIEQIRMLKVQKYSLLSLASQSLYDPVTYGKLNSPNRENEGSGNPLVTNQAQQEIVKT